jgi:hypothetical protein
MQPRKDCHWLAQEAPIVSCAQQPGTTIRQRGLLYAGHCGASDAPLA